MSHLIINYDNNQYELHYLNLRYIYIPSIIYNIYYGKVIKKYDQYYIVQILEDTCGILFIENIIGNININQYIYVQVIRNDLNDKQAKLSMYLHIYRIHYSIKCSYINNTLHIYNNDITTNIKQEISLIFNNNPLYCVYNFTIFEFVYKNKLHIDINQITSNIELSHELIKYADSMDIKIIYKKYHKILLPSYANIIYEHNATCHFFDINTYKSTKTPEEINIEAIRYILSNITVSGNIIIDLLQQKDYIEINNEVQSLIKPITKKIKTYLISDIGLLILNISYH